MPSSLMLSENVLRVVVFVAPLWLPLSLGRRGPLILFVLGADVYLASWIPALAGMAVAQRLAVYLLPYATPLIWLLALAWMGRSLPYAAAGVAFVALHTTHGALAHRSLPSSGITNSRRRTS